MSGLNLFAVRYALRPADEEHRFGHNSIEDIVGLAQFTFMLGMMLLVIVESARELLAEAHALTDALEADLRAAFPRADIMIHQEPAS